MCGIIGAVSMLKNGFLDPSRKVFREMLWADTVRGDDSTGVFGVNEYGNADYLKLGADASKMIAHEDYKDFDRKIFSDYHMVVGHNRKATRGTINDENAHPFVEGNIILVHNGTINNQHQLTKEITTVDSHSILHSIVERGHLETLKEIQGAFTLVWYDADIKKLYIARNDQRPLWLANTDDAWYFASEPRMMQWILERQEVKSSKIETLKPSVLYEFRLNDKKNMWFTPIQLYKPPKPKVHVVVTQQPRISPPVVQGDIQLLPKKEEEKEGGYDHNSFRNGMQLLVVGNDLFKAVKKKGTDEEVLLKGHWFNDQSVPCFIWMSEKDLNALSDPPFEGKPKEEVLFRATVKALHFKKGNVKLQMEKAVPYKLLTDSEGHEILYDDFIQTDESCSYCVKKVEFSQLQDGIFKYSTNEDYELVCPTCKKENKHNAV